MNRRVEPLDDPTLGLGQGSAPGIPAVDTWSGDFGGVEIDDGYDELIGAVRRFLDHAAAAKPSAPTIKALTTDLDRWSDRLADDGQSPAGWWALR